MYCDASKAGLGCVLMQSRRVMAYGHRLHLEYLAPLLIRRGVRSVLRPQKSEVYFHTAGPQYETTQMDGVPRGL